MTERSSWADDDDDVADMLMNGKRGSPFRKIVIVTFSGVNFSSGPARNYNGTCARVCVYARRGRNESSAREIERRGLLLFFSFTLPTFIGIYNGSLACWWVGGFFLHPRQEGGEFFFLFLCLEPGCRQKNLGGCKRYFFFFLFIFCESDWPIYEFLYLEVTELKMGFFFSFAVE